ncbi:MAG: tetratricopeptide repeat protein [Phycisphaerales bacterium]
MSDRINAVFDLVRLGRYAEAKPGLLRMVARNPDDHEARFALAECFFWTGQPSGATFHLDALLRAKDLREDLLAVACDLLAKTGALGRAVTTLEQRRTADSTAFNTRISLCSFYMQQAKLDEASAVLAEAEGIAPDFPIVRKLKGALFSRRGDVDAAIDAYRASLWENPGDVNLASSLAFMINGSAKATKQEVFQPHVMFGELMAQQAGTGGFTFQGRLDPDRRLKLAFVSHDINGHSVSAFLEAPVRHLDRASFEVWIYYTGTGRDATTERLAGLVDRFVHMPGVTSVDLASRVHADHIDVLIELNGHTQGHRLHAMQLRPAPLQATWLGYPNTTGLKTIDLRLVDAITDPPGVEAFNTERLVRLDPCFLCYTPIDTVPERVGAGWSRAPRSTIDDRPVFACFNAAHKINDFTISLWSRVLNRVPDSRMLVKARGASGPHSAEGVRSRFSAQGVDAARIEMIPFKDSPSEHLNTYASADIQLDTFPYHGTTTTCESLLMGVPVVTLTGDRHVSRVSTSILHAVGLGELAPSTPDAYVDAAASLAADTSRLRALQSMLPDRVRLGPLCDGRTFAATFGRAIRAAWRETCARI